MTVLSVDTANDQCAVALVRRDLSVVVSLSEPLRRGHAERAPAMVSEALARACVDPADLTLIAAVGGPGTFTGLRVGMALARGYALALEIPAVGVDGFAALALTTAGDKATRSAPTALAFGKPPNLLMRELIGGCSLGPLRRGDLSEASPASIERIVGPAPTLEAIAADPGWTGGASLTPAFVDPVVIAKLALSGGEAVSPPTPRYGRAPDATPPSGRDRPKRRSPSDTAT